MLRRLRLGLAIGSALLLFLQGSVAFASAYACMKACDQANAERAQGPSCHSEQKSKSECHPEKGCDGACSYVCAPDLATAATTPAVTVELPSFDVPAVLPSTTEHGTLVPVVEPELFQTDSSPPGQTPASSNLLRAPPALRA